MFILVLICFDFSVMLSLIFLFYVFIFLISAGFGSQRCVTGNQTRKVLRGDVYCGSRDHYRALTGEIKLL